MSSITVTKVKNNPGQTGSTGCAASLFPGLQSHTSYEDSADQVATPTAVTPDEVTALLFPLRNLHNQIQIKAS